MSQAYLDSLPKPTVQTDGHDEDDFRLPAPETIPRRRLPPSSSTTTSSTNSTNSTNSIPLLKRPLRFPRKKSNHNTTDSESDREQTPKWSRRPLRKEPPYIPAPPPQRDYWSNHPAYPGQQQYQQQPPLPPQQQPHQSMPPMPPSNIPYDDTSSPYGYIPNPRYTPDGYLPPIIPGVSRPMPPINDLPSLQNAIAILRDDVANQLEIARIANIHARTLAKHGYKLEQLLQQFFKDADQRMKEESKQASNRLKAKKGTQQNVSKNSRLPRKDDNNNKNTRLRRRNRNNRRHEKQLSEEQVQERFGKLQRLDNFKRTFQPRFDNMNNDDSDNDSDDENNTVTVVDPSLLPPQSSITVPSTTNTSLSTSPSTTTNDVASV